MTYQRPVTADPHCAGTPPLTSEELNGIWCFRFGPLGAAEAEMMTAFARLESGSIFGGDSNFVMRGTYYFDGIILKSFHSAEVHSAPENFQTIFGNTNREYNVVMTAHVLDRDLIEGTTKSTIGPSASVILRRFGPL